MTPRPEMRRVKSSDGTEWEIPNDAVQWPRPRTNVNTGDQDLVFRVDSREALRALIRAAGQLDTR